MSESGKCPSEELLAAFGFEADALSPSEEKDLRAHLETCAVCRETLEQNRRAASALRAIPAARPSQAARDRAYAAVLKAMEAPRERVAERATSAKRSPVASAPRAKAAPVAAAKPVQTHGFRVLVGSLTAAACLFIVAGVFFAGSSSRTASAPNSPRMSAKLPADATSADSETAMAPHPLERPARRGAPSAPQASAPMAPTPPPSAPPPSDPPGDKDGASGLAPAEALVGKKDPAEALKESQGAEARSDESRARAEDSPKSNAFLRKRDDKAGATEQDVPAARLAAREQRELLLAKARKMIALDTFADDQIAKGGARAPGKQAQGTGDDRSAGTPRNVTGPRQPAKPNEAPAADEKTEKSAEGGGTKSAEKSDATKPEPSKPEATKSDAQKKVAGEPHSEAKAKAPAKAGAKDEAAREAEAFLFADPGTETRRLLVLPATEEAFWVAAPVTAERLGASDARTPIRPETAIENELLLRILDEHLARDAKDMLWARKADALERAIEAARVRANLLDLERKEAAPKSVR